MNTTDKPKTGNDKKSGGILLPLFLIFLLVAGVYFYFNFGNIITSTAEKVASSALGTDVKIGSVQIMPTEMKISVNDIRIANPKGFSGANALTIGEIAIAAGEMSKELLNFTEVTLKDAEVFLEVTQNGSNLGAIKENANKGKTKSSAEEQTAESDSQSVAPKVIVDKFTMTGTKLYPKTTIVETDLTTVIVPDIKLSGIGKRENGILAQEAVVQIFNAVSNKLMKASASAGMLQGLSAEHLKGFGISGGTIDKIKEGAGDIGEDLNKATDKIKGLFGD